MKRLVTFALLLFFVTAVGAAAPVNVTDTGNRLHATISLDEPLQAPSTLRITDAVLCAEHVCSPVTVTSTSYTPHPAAVDVFLTPEQPGNYTLHLTGETVQNQFTAATPVTITQTDTKTVSPTGHAAATSSDPVIAVFLLGVAVFAVVWLRRDSFDTGWTRVAGISLSFIAAAAVIAPILHELVHSIVLAAFNCAYTVDLNFLSHHTVTSLDCGLTPVHGFVFLLAGPAANLAGFTAAMIPVLHSNRFHHPLYLTLPLGMAVAAAFSFFPPHSDVYAALQLVMQPSAAMVAAIGAAVFTLGSTGFLWVAWQQGMGGR